MRLWIIVKLRTLQLVLWIALLAECDTWDLRRSRIPSRNTDDPVTCTHRRIIMRLSYRPEAALRVLSFRLSVWPSVCHLHALNSKTKKIEKPKPDVPGNDFRSQCQGIRLQAKSKNFQKMTYISFNDGLCGDLIYCQSRTGSTTLYGRLHIMSALGNSQPLNDYHTVAPCWRLHTPN